MEKICSDSVWFLNREFLASFEILPFFPKYIHGYFLFQICCEKCYSGAQKHVVLSLVIFHKNLWQDLSQFHYSQIFQFLGLFLVTFLAVPLISTCILQWLTIWFLNFWFSKSHQVTFEYYFFGHFWPLVVEVTYWLIHRPSAQLYFYRAPKLGLRYPSASILCPKLEVFLFKPKVFSQNFWKIS